MSWETLQAAAEAWRAQDPDGSTREELTRLIEARDAQELAERFAGPLTFGTAGLRGIIGAGETRMNRAVVIRATAGLAAWLLERHAEQARTRGVAVGFDGRRLSRTFAEDVAGVLAARGIKVHLSQGTCPTPVLAFAARRAEAAAGVMVTASHNPPEYNGYKVYGPNAAQIVPPTDAEIAQAIAACPGAHEVERLTLDEARSRGLLEVFGDEVDRAYLDGVRELSLTSEGDRGLTIVYTPLHGVGDRLTRAALAEAGFTDVHTVPQQAEPDGAFPTVAFPNPEEPGSMDLVLALAREREAPLVLANDPDADRLAVAVRTTDGAYRQLTGNEVGVLLGHFALTHGWGAEGDRVALTTIVSSPLLGRMARALGVRYEETLTGFKWIANRALDLQRETGTRFVFGYEEALGYTVGSLVRDKDGISAAVLMSELAALLRSRGQTLLDELEAIARRYGLFVSRQVSVKFPGNEGARRMQAIMEDLRGDPPTRIGPGEVEATIDYAARRRRTRDGAVTELGLPAGDVVAFELAGGSRIIARPSGTEPKIKFYFDVREPMREGEPLGEAEARALAQIEALEAAFKERTGTA